ncbi:MAG: AraC family transcriptional regulator [Trebonia sp.]
MIFEKGHLISGQSRGADGTAGGLGPGGLDPGSAAGEGAGQSLPLSQFGLLHTRDVDQARHVVAGAFCPHRLIPLEGARRFETTFNPMRTGDVRLCYLDYGGDVHITAQATGSFYLVLIPLAGRAEITVRREEFRYGPGAASVTPLDGTYDIRVAGGSPHLAAWISRDRLEEHLRATLARPAAEPVRFGLGMDLTAPRARSWLRTVRFLQDEIDGGGLIPGEPLAMRHLEELLLTGLLHAQPSNYSDLLASRPGAAAPATIRRAVTVIEDHAAEQLTVTAIAAASGISLRALQDGFRRHLGTTPSAYLHEVRLRHVHGELTAADPASTTVTRVAARWGFLQPGRFAARYRERFGEPPSAALRR